MTAAGFPSIEFDPPLDDLARGIDGWAAALDDFDPVLERAQILFQKQMQVHFNSEGRATGRPWRPLTRAWALRKARSYPGRPMLVASGALRASLVSGGPGFLANVGTGRATFGTTVSYADDVAAEGRDPVRIPDEDDERGFAVAVERLFEAYAIWSRKRALNMIASDDPFTDANFSHAAVRAMTRSSGSDADLDRATRSIAREIR